MGAYSGLWDPVWLPDRPRSVATELGPDRPAELDLLCTVRSPGGFSIFGYGSNHYQTGSARPARDDRFFSIAPAREADATPDRLVPYEWTQVRIRLLLPVWDTEEARGRSRVWAVLDRPGQ